MTLRELDKARRDGQRPDATVWLLCGLPAYLDSEIACDGRESAGELVGCFGLDVAIRHPGWSVPELESLILRLLACEPRTLAVLDDVTGEWVILKLSTGELGAWDVTEWLQ